MANLVISLAATDDSSVEGSETYTVALANAGSTTGAAVTLSANDDVTTTIVDNDTASWSIAGSASVTEGDDASYTVSLAGTLQSGETATIDLSLTDGTTTAADHAAFAAAVTAAIGARTDLSFDGTTLTYTGDGSPMANLVISLAATDDSSVEGSETYTVALANAGSTTGAAVTLSANDDVTTTIVDNDTASWSIAGSASVTEGDDASYTVSLAGTLQSGETATIDLSLTDGTTTAADHAAFAAAVTAAIGARTDLSFDGTTLTYTGDGSPMADLVISLAATDDSSVEGSETYTVALANAGSTTGAAVTRQRRRHHHHRRQRHRQLVDRRLGFRHRRRQRELHGQPGRHAAVGRDRHD